MASKRKKPKAIRKQEPELRTPTNSLELEYREGLGYMWPKGIERPNEWHVRAPIPCPECNRVRLPDTKQAVVCLGMKNRSVAYLRCKGCEHRWKVPIVHS